MLSCGVQFRGKKYTKTHLLPGGGAEKVGDEKSLIFWCLFEKDREGKSLVATLWSM